MGKRRGRNPVHRLGSVRSTVASKTLRKCGVCKSLGDVTSDHKNQNSCLVNTPYSECTKPITYDDHLNGFKRAFQASNVESFMSSACIGIQFFNRVDNCMILLKTTISKDLTLKHPLF